MLCVWYTPFFSAAAQPPEQNVMPRIVYPFPRSRPPAKARPEADDELLALLYWMMQ